VPADGGRETKVTYIAEAVTVLFADAVGSTPLAEQLGEEEMYSFIRECLSRMTEAVHRYEGHVAHFTGDGMMALFGAPIAHEDSARRAVAAGLRMQRSLDRYASEMRQRHGAECRFRVGLNTGQVVVGTVTDDLQMDFTAIGDKALDYLSKAGDKATAAYATQDALRFYAQAVEVCETLGDKALPAVASLAASRGFVNFGIGDIPAAIADIDRMVEVGQRLGSRALVGTGLGYRTILEVYDHDFEGAEETLRSAWVVIGEGFEEALPVANLAQLALLVFSNRIAEVDPVLALAESAPTMPDPLTDGLSNGLRGMLQYWRGHFDEALQVLGGVSERAERIVTSRLFNWWVRGMTLASRGEYEDALDVLQKTLDLCQRLGDEQIRTRAVNTVGWVFGEMEDHAQAQELNRLGVRLVGSLPGRSATEIEMNARLNLGDNLAVLGRPDEAEEQFKTVETVVRSPEPAQRSMLWRYSQHLFHSYGELWLGRGEPAKALDYADECLELAEETLSRKYVVKARRLRGRALMAQGRLDDAEQELLAALELAIELRNPPQLWRTHAAIGDLRRAQGRTADPRRAYSEALAVIEAVAAGLTDERRREIFRHSEQVQAVRRAAQAAAQHIGTGTPLG
jgi:tetratricopeptide (TPR) repeat protein